MGVVRLYWPMSLMAINNYCGNIHKIIDPVPNSVYVYKVCLVLKLRIFLLPLLITLKNQQHICARFITHCDISMFCESQLLALEHRPAVLGGFFLKHAACFFSVIILFVS